MSEIIIREKIVIKIRKEIDIALDRYYEKYKEHIGYLLYYPLINVEYDFINNRELLYGVIEKEKTTWFLKNMIKRGLRTTNKFIFKPDEFEYYKNNLGDKIHKLYDDYNFSKEIEDDRSVCKCQITEIDKNKYELISALVTGKYLNHAAYYWGYGDELEFNNARTVMYDFEKYLYNRYPFKNNKSNIRDIRRLIIDIDSDFLNLSIKRVDSDMFKIGNRVCSNIIGNRKELSSILGFLVYISQIINVSYKMYNTYKGKLDTENFIRVFDKVWIVNKINKIFNIDKTVIDRYINYFAFNGQGTLSDFPIILNNDYIIIVPSLILLNDWQFSITNGHYAKGIEFIRRDKTISQSVVDKVYDKFSKFINITVIKEKYYEFIDNNGNKVNSDIDIAIYDKVSNTILVLECKWKDNHYVNDSDENYIKIEKSLKDIFKKQISKHKEFIEKDIKNIEFIFEDVKEEVNINNNTKIYYIALDKRSEFHVNEQHMVSLYCILALSELYSRENILDLVALIKDINNAKMKIEYYMVSESKEFNIGDISIVNDELNLDYDSYFL